LCIDFPSIFSVDVVRLGLESEIGHTFESYYPEEHYSGMVLIETGVAADMLAPAQEVRFVADSRLDHPWAIQTLFHECSALAGSAAYMAVPLPKAGRAAILAFGVREAGRFQDGQGTELLRFLAQVLSLRLDQLLYEQAGLL
jgi:uncharacterized protein